MSKIRKSAQCDLTFIFIKLSETLNSFTKIRLVLEMKDVASLTKTRFYSKRGCIQMRKHAETFHANKGCKLAILFLKTISPFSK